VHRAAIRIEDDGRAIDVVILREQKEMTWRVRSDRT